MSCENIDCKTLHDYFFIERLPLIWVALHEKSKFPLSISSVNVTSHFLWGNPKWKTSFFVNCVSYINRSV